MLKSRKHDCQILVSAEEGQEALESVDTRTIRSNPFDTQSCSRIV